MASSDYILGIVPYGRHHDSIIGRVLYVYARFLRGIAFAGVVFSLLYWENWTEIDSRLHILTFMLTAMHGMRGSIYQEDQRTLEFVRKHMGGSDE